MPIDGIQAAKVKYNHFESMNGWANQNRIFLGHVSSQLTATLETCILYYSDVNIHIYFRYWYTSVSSFSDDHETAVSEQTVWGDRRRFAAACRPDRMLSSTHSLLPFLRQVTVLVTSRTKAWMLNCCTHTFLKESQRFQSRMLRLIGSYICYCSLISIHLCHQIMMRYPVLLRTRLFFFLMQKILN